MAVAIRTAGQELVAAGRLPEQALNELVQAAPRWAAIGAAQTEVVAARYRAGGK
jgi:hypothetical protein